MPSIYGHKFENKRDVATNATTLVNYYFKAGSVYKFYALMTLLNTAAISDKLSDKLDTLLDD